MTEFPCYIFVEVALSKYGIRDSILIWLYITKPKIQQGEEEYERQRNTILQCRWWQQQQQQQGETSILVVGAVAKNQRP
jgi:hypothetical protein